MKKFSFHLDMIVVVIILFLLSVGANIYQWQIHGALHKSNISNKLGMTEKHVALIDTEIALKECQDKLGADIATDRDHESSSG